MIKKYFKFRRWWKWMFISIISFFVIVLLLPLPDPLFQQNYSTVLEAKDGELLGAKIAPDGQWRFPSSDSVPQKFEIALLHFEDEYFYKHPGVNPVSLFRAIRQNVEAGKIVSGGSTLTMQVIRLARNNQPRTVSQKLFETLLAIKLDLLYSKEEILNMYASHAPFGGNVVGLSAASWRYFGRPASELSWAEAASLAVLPNNPSAIFPGRNEKPYLEKRDALLEKLLSKGIFDSTTCKLSKAESLPGKPIKMPALAQHLLFRSAKEGFDGKLVRSTIDFNLQNRVIPQVERHSQELDQNEIHNAAAIVIEVSTGNVLAYVGNSNNPGEHGQNVDVITARRSPGSALKPVLYAAAMDEGLITPKQLIPDVPIIYQGFSPKNFDKKFRGVAQSDQALSKSLNVPFVNLLKDYGYEKFHQKLQQCGITTLNENPDHYGLSIVLGGAETTLWDMTSMYASLTRSMIRYNESDDSLKYNIEDFHTNTYTDQNWPKSDSQKEGIIRAESIWYMLKAMKNVARPEEWTGWQQFESSRDISWKTGTSFGFRDAWAIGISKDYVVGVWAGNADGEGRPGLTGVRSAAPLMLRIFDLLPKSEKIKQPGGTDHKICRLSGMIATELCEETELMILPAYMSEGHQCTYHKKIWLDKSEEYQVNSTCYSVADMVEKNWFSLSAIEGWYFRSYNSSYQEPPKFHPSCQSDAKVTFMELIYPKKFTKVYVPKELDGSPGQAIFEVAHKKPSTTIYWHLDDQYLGSTTTFHQMGINTSKGHHLLNLVDEDGNTLEQRFEVVSK